MLRLLLLLLLLYLGNPSPAAATCCCSELEFVAVLVLDVGHLRVLAALRPGVLGPLLAEVVVTRVTLQARTEAGRGSKQRA
jgi:hypothetical protein